MKPYSLFLLFFLSACAIFLGERISLAPTDFNNLPGWRQDDQGKALEAFKKSCVRINKASPGAFIHESKVGGKYKSWQELCAKAAVAANPREFFENNFTPYIVGNRGLGQGLFTGYFETELQGSRRKHHPYIYPIYKTPEGLDPTKKYYTRLEIEEGALAGKGLEIAWTDDPVRLFFLHVQGSGRLKLEDGQVIRLGYDARNNHPYAAIGKYLIEQGYLSKEKVSKPAIEEWLKTNPDKMMKVMAQNPSYIFFREIAGEGPIGAQGVPLTPLRSLAVDDAFIPYGAPLWLDTVINGGDDISHSTRLQSLFIAQDTGNAINGPVRGDIFFGYGQEAEKLAGYQKGLGRYYMLLPRE